MRYKIRIPCEVKIAGAKRGSPEDVWDGGCMYLRFEIEGDNKQDAVEKASHLLKFYVMGQNGRKFT